MGGYWKPSMAPQFFHCVKRITSVLGKQFGPENLRTPAGLDGGFANVNDSLWGHKDMPLSLPQREGGGGRNEVPQ